MKMSAGTVWIFLCWAAFHPLNFMGFGDSSGLSWGWKFPKCQCILSDIGLFLGGGAETYCTHQNSSEHWFIYNTILNVMFLCFFLGTSRSFRRSWPTWTSWQKGKSVAFLCFIYLSLGVYHWTSWTIPNQAVWWLSLAFYQCNMSI